MSVKKGDIVKIVSMEGESAFVPAIEKAVKMACGKELA